MKFSLDLASRTSRIHGLRRSRAWIVGIQLFIGWVALAGCSSSNLYNDDWPYRTTNPYDDHFANAKKTNAKTELTRKEKAHQIDKSLTPTGLR